MATRYGFKPEFLENTIQSLQCFNCGDVPGFARKQKNRYSCHHNAHQLCEECKHLGFCDCGSTVGKNPNPVVHQMLKDMPIYCPHYKRDCREIFAQAQAEDLHYHEQGCVFRQVHCPHLGHECREKVIFKDVIDHLNQDHYNEKLRWNNVCNNKFTLKLPTNSLTNLSYWMARKPIKIKNGAIFFLVGMISNKFANFWIYSLLSPLETKNYAYTLSITGEKGAKFSYYNNVKPLDESADDIIAKQFAFVIGTQVIREIRNEDNKLPIEVTIHSLKEEAKDEDIESGVEDD